MARDPKEDPYFNPDFSDEINEVTNEYVYDKFNAKGKPVTGDAIILRPNQPGGIGTPITYDVLLITRKRGPHQGGLALPGGIKEAMDPAGDSFIGREALEEVGMTADDIVVVHDLEPKLDRHSWDVRATNGVDVHGKMYIVDDSFQAVAADDALSHKWVSMDDIVTTDIAFGHSEWIADAAKELGVDKELVNKLDNKVLDDIKRNIKFMQEVSKKRLADGQPDFNFNKMGEEVGSRINVGDIVSDLEGSPDMPLSSAFDKHMAGITFEELSEWYGEKYGRDYITDTKTMTLDQIERLLNDYKTDVAQSFVDVGDTDELSLSAREWLNENTDRAATGGLDDDMALSINETDEVTLANKQYQNEAAQEILDKVGNQNLAKVLKAKIGRLLIGGIDILDIYEIGLLLSAVGDPAMETLAAKLGVPGVEEDDRPYKERAIEKILEYEQYSPTAQGVKKYQEWKPYGTMPKPTYDAYGTMPRNEVYGWMKDINNDN
tara:strand:- start:2798 stop:4270 length:1473 start_codon:yes stop_codon:yes gene_type:complete